MLALLRCPPSTPCLPSRWVLWSILVLSSCGGGDGTGNTGSIQVSVNPASLSVVQGGSGTIEVTLSRSGGFSGSVSLSVTGLPPGITFSVSPSPVTGPSTSATVTVNVATTVAPGSYSATVQASASGVSSASATYTITVSEMPNYVLTVFPPELSIEQAQSAGTTVTITRTGGFAGAVTLSLDNPPPGITADFVPNNTADPSSAVTVNVAPGMAAGLYRLMIKGEAQGLITTVGPDSQALAVGDRTATLPVIVSLAIAEPVEFHFCSPQFNPIFFAYQDGAGTWTPVEEVLENGIFKYRFQLHHFRGGVYYVQETPINQAMVG